VAARGIEDISEVLDGNECGVELLEQRNHLLFANSSADDVIPAVARLFPRPLQVLCRVPQLRLTICQTTHSCRFLSVQYPQ